ncbi:inorganic diphosphatase [Fulvivirga ligni]|uniref:inorganic diphosphatase n=1 Tax=Fulvivirga ligni TaxID=2904246 RepID=UPI001F36A22D|nr:inorganic diphosphatase [Fulvivirga ligni]UII22166.1 inorganic diphosphatase [Fulvivirga ligni]
MTEFKNKITLIVLGKSFRSFFKHFKHFKPLLILLSAIILYSCDTNHYNASVFSYNGHVQMVVEIPAGTNVKYEFNLQSKTFETDTVDGLQRTVRFLPYPGNYGFIPSTLMDSAKGGDGDALDVLLLSSAAEQGKLIEIIPVAVLKLLDHGEKDDKIIAIPADEKLRMIDCETLTCFQEAHPNAIKIINLWFTGYKEDMKFVGWGDEREAMETINNWKK